MFPSLITIFHGFFPGFSPIFGFPWLFPWFFPYFWWKKNPRILGPGMPRCPGQDAMEGWAPGPLRRHPRERRLRRRGQGGGANRCADREPVLKAHWLGWWGDEGWDFWEFLGDVFPMVFPMVFGNFWNFLGVSEIFWDFSDGFSRSWWFFSWSFWWIWRISAGNLKRFYRILVYSGWFVMIFAEILIAVNRMLVVIWWLFTGFYGGFRWTWFAIYSQYSWHFHNCS